jgi:hypothetical protein
MDPREAPVALNLIKGVGSMHASNIGANSREKITTRENSIDPAGGLNRIVGCACFFGTGRHF